MVSYMDDNVKNNSSKYFGRWLLSVGHGGRWWLATWTTMQRTTLTSTSIGGYCRGSWWHVVVSYMDDNVKNNSPNYVGRWLLSMGHGGIWWLATWTTM